MSLCAWEQQEVKRASLQQLPYRASADPLRWGRTDYIPRFGRPALAGENREQITYRASADPPRRGRTNYIPCFGRPASAGENKLPYRAPADPLRRAKTNYHYQLASTSTNNTKNIINSLRRPPTTHLRWIFENTEISHLLFGLLARDINRTLITNSILVLEPP